MPVYLIADVKVTDDAWIPDYAANVHDIVHKHGGKYLSRSANITTIEGDALDTVRRHPLDAATDLGDERR